MEKEQLNFEKLDVYKCSVILMELSYRLVDMLPKGNATLIDQLKRASLSVPLNIAEGSGKQTDSEKKRFYHIARASAFECAAILDCSLRLKLCQEELLIEARNTVVRIVKMLTKMILN